MMIKNNSIFYFSGTGNSLQVAKDLSNHLIDMAIEPITAMMQEENITIEADIIGFVFPVYMLGIPLIVADFLKKINIKKSTYTFAIATCGGNAGMTFNQINEILESKALKLSSEFIIKMPGNNILRYGAKSQEKQLVLFQLEKIKVLKISQIIATGLNVTFQEGNPIIKTIIAPILYKKLQKTSGKTPDFHVAHLCIGCGLCQKVCSVKNIQMTVGKPQWKSQCQQCMACIQYCPKEAIQYGNKTIGRTRYQNPNVDILVK